MKTWLNISECRGGLIHRNELPLFDAAEAERLKTEGITVAVENNAVLVEQFRDLAKRIARNRPDRTVNMDMLYIDETHTRRLKAMGNSRGGIFRGREWEFVEYTKSERIESHGNRLVQHKLVG